MAVVGRWVDYTLFIGFGLYGIVEARSMHRIFLPTSTNLKYIQLVEYEA